MPKQAYSDVTTDAEQVLTSTAANPDLQPIVEKHRPQVEEELNAIKALKALQKTLTADKQKTTQDLQAAMKRLKEKVLFLAGCLFWWIGEGEEEQGVERQPAVGRDRRNDWPAVLFVFRRAVNGIIRQRPYTYRCRRPN